MARTRRPRIDELAIHRPEGRITGRYADGSLLMGPGAGRHIVGGPNAATSLRPGVGVQATSSVIGDVTGRIPRPDAINLPRMGPTMYPAQSSAAIQNRAGIGLAAMERGGGVNANVAAIKAERAAAAEAARVAAQPRQPSEKERIAIIEAESREAVEKAKQDGFNLREGTFEQTAQQAKDIQALVNKGDVDVVKLRGVYNLVQDRLKGLQPDTEQYNTVRANAIADAKQSAIDAGDLEGIRAAAAMKRLVLEENSRREMVQWEAKFGAQEAGRPETRTLFDAEEKPTGSERTQTGVTSPKNPVAGLGPIAAPASPVDINGDGDESADEKRFNRISIALRDKKDALTDAQKLILNNELSALKKRLLPGSR